MTSDTEVLAAIASPRRQEILRLVWRKERSAGDIHDAMPDVTFGAVSLHLRKLLDGGLVTVRVDGRRRYYAADHEALGPARLLLEQMWSDALWKLKLHAELEHARRGPRPHRRRSRRSRGRRDG